jgi:hypothetical protein
VRGLGFLFCRPKHLPRAIYLLWPSITSTSLYAPPHTFSLPPPHLVSRPRPIPSVWTRFSVLQAKTAPTCDLAILGSHHLNHLMYLTPHVIITLSTSYTNPPLISGALHTISAFAGQNRPHARSRNSGLPPPQPPHVPHPTHHNHPLHKLHQPPTDIEGVAHDIAIWGSKSPPPHDLMFSASHHLNHLSYLTSHVP